MVHWKEVLTRLSPDAESRMEELRGRLCSQIGGVGPLKIIAFRGYGTPERLFLRGRVIEEKVFLAGEKNERVWADLVNIYTHARSACVPNAHLVARFQGAEQTIHTDEEGYFEAALSPSRSLSERRLWHQVEFHLLDPIPETQNRYPIKTMGEVLVPADTARYAVITDIDDAFAPNDSTHLLRTARHAFLRSARTPLPFPGEAALYRALYNGGSGMDLNPLFYISSGRGAIYNLLVQFLNLQSMPSGPILFPRKNRLSALRRMLDLYPHLPFIFVGGSQPDDPEIYAELAARYPGRIPAIYIRNTGCPPNRMETLRQMAGRLRSSGSALVLANDSLAIARHASRQGFLPLAALPAIAEEIQKDQTPPGPVEELLALPAAPRSVKFSRQAVKKDASAQEYSQAHSNKKNK